MPRDSNGTYTLYTPGNPVVTGTTISSSWANNTLDDLATAMTDSLSRSGNGSMTAGLELFAGTSALPGLSWALETTSGMYRNAAGDFRWVISTTELLQLQANLFQLSGTAPIFRINESDAAANNRLWDVIASAEDLNFRVLTDALVATNWLTITRTAGTVDAITATSGAFTATGTSEFTFSASTTVPTIRANANFPWIELRDADATADNRRWAWFVSAEQLVWGVISDAGGVGNILTIDRTGTTVDAVNFGGTLQYGGIEVGYRGMPGRNITGNDNTVASDAGKFVAYTGSGGHTFACDGDFPVNGVMTILNAGTGTLSITGSTSLSWYNGSGAIGSGTRTLAIGGVATVTVLASAGNFSIYGSGLT